MTSFSHLGWWFPAAVTVALNIPLGGMRANAVRRSHRWFGLLAAPVFLSLALRHAFNLAWIEALALVGAMFLGQYFGRRMSTMTTEPSPTRWRTAAYAALLAGLLLFIGAPVRAHHPGPHGNQWERLDADEPAPAFALIDQNGKRVALKDFRGTAIIVTFLFTRCADVCPLLAQRLAQVDEQLSEMERARLRFVGISVDPRRDTPRQMKRFLRERNLSEARWTLLTGSVKTLTRTAHDYGVVVRPTPNGDLVHNSVFILIDGKGRERVEFHGLATPTEEIAKAVRTVTADDTRTQR